MRSTSSGEKRSPYTSRLARSVSQRRAGQVQQRRQPGRRHRQQQDGPLLVRRCAAETDDDDDVDDDHDGGQPGDLDRAGQQAVDAGDHRRQRAEDQGDRDQPGEGEGDGAGLVRPVGEHPQGAGDDGRLGGDGHAPTDPLHPAAIDGTGLDVADVAGVQAEADRQRPQHGDRPAHQAIAVGHQRQADADGDDVAGDDGAPPDRRRQAAVGEAEQQVHGDGREQGGRQAQGEVPERRRRTVERLVLDHRRGERADAADDGAAEDDRRQPVVTAADPEGEPGAGPEGDDDRADELDRQRIVADGDDGAGDGEGDGDRGDEQAVRRPQRGERRRHWDRRGGGWRGRLDGRRHHLISGHHGRRRGQGCCHRRPGGASHTPSIRVSGHPSVGCADAAHHALRRRQTLGWGEDVIRRGGSGRRGTFGGRGARRGRG